MRAALESIQQIEQYLLNEMSAVEKLAFENEINSNPTLKSQVETQQQLVEGIQRIGLKASAVRAKAKYQLRKWSIRLGVLLALISLSSFTYIYLNSEEDCVPCNYETSESNVDRPYQPNCCPQIEANSSPVESMPETIEEFTDEDSGEEYTPGSVLDTVPTAHKTEVETIESDEDVIENGESNPIITNDILIPKVEFNGNGNSTIKNYALKVKPNDNADPTFPGGQDELLRWLSMNTIYPQKAIDQGIAGTVYVDFVVSKTGNISTINVQKSVHPILDAAAVATVKKIPKWNPAVIEGKYVDAKYTLPIRYFTEGSQN